MKTKILILGIGVLSIVLLIVSAAKSYIENPEYCGSCHLMRTRYVSYKRSVHHRAICKDCHSAPGCVSCHDVKNIDRDMEKHIPEKTMTRFAHEQHTDMNISCKTCHVRMMHDKMDGSHEKQPSEACGNCHSQTDFINSRLGTRM